MTFIATCRPVIKKLLLQNVSTFDPRGPKLISKQEMELSKQEMEIVLPFSGLYSKNFFYKLFLNYIMGSILTYFRDFLDFRKFSEIFSKFDFSAVFKKILKSGIDMP